MFRCTFFDFIHFLLRKNTALLGDSDSRYWIITSDHSYCNTSFLNLSYSFWYFRSNDIHNAENASQGEVRLFNVLYVSAFIVMSPVLISINVFESKSNCSQSILGIGVNLILDLVTFMIVNWLFVTIFIQKVCASFKNNFRATLGIHSLFVGVACIFNILTDCRHSFTFGRERETNVLG